MSNWKELRNELNLSEQDEIVIKMEKDLIKAMVSVRESQGMSQAELSVVSNVKQPTIARMERAAHSPRIDSILKLLVPLGYTLKIVPLSEAE